MIRATILAATVASMVAVPSLANEEGFGAQAFTLDNGMRIVAVPFRRAPVVHHAVYYRIGAADDPFGQSGISHFLEHLMFNVSATLADGEYSRIVARNGGRSNAYTSSDVTAYFATIARDRLERVMELEADRMTGTLFERKNFEAERQVVLEERLTRTERNPSALFREELVAATRRSHPYGRPVIGWRHEIEALNMEQVEAFYRRHYGPSNAILVVVGDIDADELRPLAERTFGQVPSGGKPPPPRPTEPPHRTDILVEMSDTRVANARWSRSIRAPSYFTGPIEKIAALDVLAELFGGSTGRLSRSLVHDREIALSAGAHFSGSQRDEGTFILHATPAPGISIDEVANAVDEEIQRLLEEGTDIEDVQRTAYQFFAGTIYARDNLETIADLIGRTLVNGGTLEELDSFTDVVRGLEAADIDAAARELFSTPASVTGILRPATEEGT